VISAAKVILGTAGAVELTIAPNGGVKRSPVTVHIPGLPGIAQEAFGWGDRSVPAIGIVTEVSLFEPVRLREHTEYDFTVIINATEEQIANERESNPVFPFRADKLLHYLSFNSEDACSKLEDGRYRITGRLNFGEYAGKADLSLVERFRLEVLIEVVSCKLRYEKEYQRLLEELSEVHAQLILNMDGATEVALRTDFSRQATDQMQIFHLRRLFREAMLPQSLAAIISQPHYRYVAELKHDPVAFVTDPDLTEMAVDSSRCNWSHGGPLGHVFHGYTPEVLPSHSVEMTYDTDANRYVKTVLRSLHANLLRLSSRVPKHYVATHTALRRWIQELNEFLQYPLWATVGNSSATPNSMVLQQRQGYRDFLRNVLTFDFGLLLNTTVGECDPTSGDLHPAWQLYELWCYFQLRKVLESLCSSTGTPTLEHMLVDRNYKVDLKKGKDTGVRFDLVYDGKPVILVFYYNRTFRRIVGDAPQWSESYSAPFHPDFSLEITVGGTKHWIHFDAKYKFDLAQWKAAVDASEVDAAIDERPDRPRSYKTEDLEKVHCYRDALLGTRASFILYPGTAKTADLFIRHVQAAYRDNVPGPCVGAISLTPEADAGDPADLSEISKYLSRLIGTIVSASYYSEESGFPIPTS
jgi:uncharacterized protein